jgi:hypothetical protein
MDTAKGVNAGHPEFIEEIPGHFDVKVTGAGHGTAKKQKTASLI